MNTDLKLKLQAWVDGELPDEEAGKMEALIADNGEAAALVRELRVTCSFLAGNELDVSVPESRDFYWSKIRRGIERAEAMTSEGSVATPTSILGALRRFMVPASALAVVMLLAALSVKYFGPDSLENAALQMVEVENLSEEMGSISYRSQADNMFVVYLYAKDQGAVPAESDSVPLDDFLFQ